MKPYFHKRCIAYIIDVLIVLVLSMLITGIIPISEKAKVISENIIELNTGVSEEKITIEKYNKEIQSLNYELTKETVIISLINISVYLLYFAVYPLYNNGQTIGKRFQKIKIVNKTNNEATMNNLLIRTMILHGTAINIVILVLIMMLNKTNFILVNNYLNYLQYLILIITILMMIFSKSGKGLHDILSNTMVINEEEKK